VVVQVAAVHGEVPVVVETHHQLHQAKEAMAELEGHNQGVMVLLAVAVLLRRVVMELLVLAVMVEMERLQVFLDHL
jgi:hypothetical protein